MKLRDYINQHHGNDRNNRGGQKAFAEAQGVLPQQVQAWLKADWIVVDGFLYSPRRQILGSSEAK